MASCPAHEDEHPSLAVGRGDRGNTVLNCFAGCKPADIVAALGIHLKDLFLKDPPPQVLGKPEISGNHRNGHAERKFYATLEEFIRKLGNRYGGKWLYPPANGTQLAVIRKNASESEKKACLPFYRVDGGWRMGKPSGLTPLLYSDTFGDAETIYLHEGEGCADAGAAIGLIPSTTWAGGCNAIQRTDWRPIGGKNVFFFLDKDSSGEKAGHLVATTATGQEYGARIKIIRLTDLPAAGDIVDYIEARRHQDAATIRQGILEIIDATPEWTPESAKPPPMSATESVLTDDDIRKLHFAAVNLPWTELWVARKLVLLHGKDIRFCKAFGWLVWTGIRWERDDTGEVSRRAKDTIRCLYSLARQIHDDDERQRYLRFVMQCETRAKIESIVTLAGTEPEIAVRPEIFDADPWVLNCLDGTIDLKTGFLRPHHRQDYCMKLAPVAYDANATCPRFDQFMQEVFSSNQEMIAFCDRAIGHALTGIVRDHILHLWYGPGCNGKSVLTEAILEAMGDYALRAPSKLLIVKRNESHSTDKAALCGARFVSSSESGEGQVLDEEFVKALTGGDRVTARFCHKDNFSFPATWKIALFTNSKPIIRGQDHGIWRRVLSWPFLEIFVDALDPDNPQPGEKDPKLAEKLRQEYPGILARWVRGCLEWQRIGLSPPAIVKVATEEYRNECDLMGTYLIECCELGVGFEESASVLYGCYVIWAKENGLMPMSNVAFSKSLLQRPGIDRTEGRTRRYIGIKICEGWREKYEVSGKKGGGFGSLLD